MIRVSSALAGKSQAAGPVLVRDLNGSLWGMLSAGGVVRALGTLESHALALKVEAYRSGEDRNGGNGERDRTDLLMLMHRRRVRYLPVLENNRLVGLISERDLTKRGMGGGAVH